jgi:hypothetical protein
MKRRWQLTAALLLLSAFAVLVGFMIWEARRDNQVDWSRLVYVFGSVEALVFTAGGWLFGSEVHRERTEAAETRAMQASDRADDATSRVATAIGESQVAQAAGTALADAVRALLAPAPSSETGEPELASNEEDSSSTNRPPAVTAADGLVSLANALFPR